MNIQGLLSKKKAIIVAVIFCLYNITCFFIIPVLAKKLLIGNLGKALDRTVTIEKVAFNPYTLSATLTGMTIQDKGDDVFVSADRTYANLSITSLFTLSLVISDVSLDQLEIHLTRNNDGSFNFSDIGSGGSDNAPGSEEESTDKDGFNFHLKKAAINQGKIIFRDKAMGTDHTIADLNIALAGLNSKREKRYESAQIEASFVLNQTSVSLDVVSTPFAEDMATTANLKTENIDVLHYLAYLPLPEKLRLNDLDINVDAHAEIKKRKDGISVVSSGTMNALKLDVKDNDTGSDILGLDMLSVVLQPSDILNSQVNLSEVILTAPKLNLERDREGALNLTRYLPGDSQEETEDTPAPESGSTQLSLKLGVFEIRNSDISFKDNANESPFHTRVSPLNLKVSEFLVEEQTSGQYALDFKTDAGEKVESGGTFSLFPLKTSGTLSVTGAGLKNYEAYLEQVVAFAVEKGVLNVNCEFDVEQNEEGLAGRITLPSASLMDLEIFQSHSENKNNETRMISLPELSVSGTAVDLAAKQVETGKISAKNGLFSLMRGPDGRFVLVESIVQKPAPAQGEAEQADNASGEEEAAWKVVVDSFDMDNWRLDFRDFSNTDPVKIDLSAINIHADGLQTFGEKSGNVSVGMNWNKKGKIGVKGKMDLNALDADLDIKVSKLDIESVQPYFSDTVKILVTSGYINTKGTFGLRLSQESSRFNFSGSTSITDFVSLDKEESKDFFKCGSLFVSDITFSALPLKFETQAVSLTDFYSRVIINESGELNLAQIFKSDQKVSEAEEAVEQEEVESEDVQVPHIKIDSVTLQAGNVSLSDNFTKPNFNARMKEITGSVTGLSSDPDTRASLHLQGLHGYSSPLEVIGEINPLAAKKYIDVGISYKDIELSNFTPYSAKFLGYKIEKGKLILDLEYTVDGNSLKSENRVRFDNLTLGEPVESEHATALPVSLAISLLKDRDGQIDLDLPVTGELDDPEFSVGGIILEMIGNLIMKAVTSPFSLIGAMFGGGEDLGYVDFAYGETRIDDTGLGKLDTLVEILTEKPDIDLEIQGLYHPSGDAASLREKGYVDLLKAEKLKDMVKDGKEVDTLDEVSLEESEYEALIIRAYENADFPKPTVKEGKEKEIEFEEKVKLLKTSIKIDQDDLRLLAMERSKAIKASIVAGGKIDRGRVFLLEPRAVDEKEETFESGRALFSLK